MTTTIFSHGSLGMGNRDEQAGSSVFFQQQHSGSMSSAQFLTPVATLKFGHSVLATTVVSTPVGDIYVACGSRALSAVLVRASTSGSTGLAHWAFDDATLSTVSMPDTGTVVTAVKMPTSSNSAFGVVGTASGAVSTFTLTVEGSGIKISLNKTDTFSVDSPIVSASIVMDENGRIRYVAAADTNQVFLIHARSFQPVTPQEGGTQTVPGCVTEISAAPQLPHGHPLKGQLPTLTVVSEDGSFHAVVCRSEPIAFHEKEDFASLCPVTVELIPLSPGHEETIVNAAHVVVGAKRSCVIVGGPGWWGHDTVVAAPQPEDDLGNGEQQGSTMRKTLTASKLAIVESINEDNVIFTSVNELYLGSCSVGLGAMMRPLRQVGSFPLPISAVSVVQGATPCFIAVTGSKAMIFVV